MVALAKRENAVEIDVDSPQNSNLLFLPIQQSVRGRFDYLRCAEVKAHGKVKSFGGKPIPGRRIGVNFDTGEGYIVEPLLEPENELQRELIAKQGFRIPQDEQFGKIDLATWFFWMSRAVAAGLARIVKGELPATIDGTPNKYFYSKPAESDVATLKDAINRQSAMLEKQNELFAALLSRLADK